MFPAKNYHSHPVVEIGTCCSVKELANVSLSQPDMQIPSYHLCRAPRKIKTQYNEHVIHWNLQRSKDWHESSTKHISKFKSSYK